MFWRGFLGSLHRLPDVLGCFHARSPLGNTAGKSRAGRHKYAIFILSRSTRYFIFSILYQSVTESALAQRHSASGYRLGNQADSSG